MSLTLLDEETSTSHMIALLDCFCLAIGLVLNWDKSRGYRKSLGGAERTAWTQSLNIVWIEGDDIRKLLGTPFGLSLSAPSVDSFMQEGL